MAETTEKSKNTKSENKEISTNNKKVDINDQSSKKRKKEVAPYGNYRSYYGYRVGNDIEEDPRFKVLKKEWFEGKDCLDIGCNSGLITINIAVKFYCRSILGVDIDQARINDSSNHLRKFMQSKIGNKRNVAPKSKVIVNENALEDEHACSTSSNNVKDGSLVAEPNLFDIVSFQCGNFVTSTCQLPLKNYDTIICLSVTKWVHLNWGDEGLISLFSKIWKLLHPGGILILEPQPWKSYYNNRRTTETTNMYYHKIIFKPQYFQEILLDKIGFRSVEQATSSVAGASLGFDRPVLVFRK